MRHTCEPGPEIENSEDSLTAHKPFTIPFSDLLTISFGHSENPADPGCG